MANAPKRKLRQSSPTRYVKVFVHKDGRVTARRIKREQDRLYGKL